MAKSGELSRLFAGVDLGAPVKKYLLNFYLVPLSGYPRFLWTSP